MNIPLINTNDKESINTSLIAIKRATEELNNLIKIADEKMAQLDEKAKKYTDDKINALDVASVGGSGKYISAISEADGKISATEGNITSTVSSGNSQPVTSGGVASAKYTKIFDVKTLSVSGWYKIATFQRRNYGASISIDLFTGYSYHTNSSHKIQINFGWTEANVSDFAKDYSSVFDKVRICYNSNNVDDVAIYVHYSKDVQNPASLNINAGVLTLTPINFETDSLTWDNTIEYNLGSSGLYINGQSYNLINSVTSGSLQPVTSNAVYNELYYTTRAYQVAFTAFFTANTTVHIADFVNAVVNSYGKGFKDLSFIWSNGNQGYITDGVTSILMNGNFIRGYFTTIAEGYNWVRCQYLTYNINNGKVYIIEVARDSSTIAEHIYPLN